MTVRAEPRLVILETIREFALDRLAERPEATAIRRLHAEYYLALAEAADGHEHGPDQHDWLDRLEAEHDNLRAALAWSATSADSLELGLRLVSALGQFWHVRGYFSEGRRWLQRLLQDNGGNPVVRAKALFYAGVLAVEQADYVQAAKAAEASLALYTTAGDQSGQASAYRLLGVAARTSRDFERAAQLIEISLDLYRSVGDVDGSAQSLTELAIVALRQGDYASAGVLLEQALDLLQQVGEPYDVATVQYMLGIAARNQGDFGRAIRFFEESLSLCEELDSQLGIATAILELAGLRVRPRPLCAGCDAVSTQSGPSTLAEDEARDGLCSVWPGRCSLGTGGKPQGKRMVQFRYAIARGNR